MKPKLKLIFDATIICNAAEKTAARSGIFVVAYSLLREMLLRNDLEIYFYCDNRKLFILKDLLVSDENLKNAKMLDIYNCFDFAISNLYNKKYLNKVNKGGFVKKIIIKSGLIIFKFINYFIGKLTAPITKHKLKKYNAYFSAISKAPCIINDVPSIKQYIFLHDTIPLLYPENFPELKTGNFWYSHLIESINSDKFYFANSENTRNDFIRLVPKIDANKIKVVPLAASDNFYKCEDKSKILAAKQKYNIPENKKYIFSLCTIEPRKNLVFAVKSFVSFIKKNQIDDLYFILGGSQWDKFISQLESAMHGLDKYKDKIIRAGYIDDEDLSPLYSDAFCFLYPSLYEGFGLPPLEAMQCGCPVITSNTSSLPEVVGDCGTMINPQSETELVSALENLYKNKNLCNEFSIKGME